MMWIAPKLDTSVLPFQCSVQVDRFMARDVRKLIEGRGRVVSLTGSASNKVLRGHAGERDNQTALRGQTDDSDHNVLHGHAVERANPQVPLTTFEHNIHSQFHIDVQNLAAHLAPDLFQQMEAEMQTSRKRAAGDTVASSRLMEQELHARVPRPSIPAVPPTARGNLAKTSDMEHERQNALQIGSVRIPLPTIDLANLKLPALPAVKLPNLASADAGIAMPKPHQESPLRIPGVMHGGAGMPHGKNLVAQMPHANSAVNDAEHEMQSELQSVNTTNGTTSQLAAQLEAAKRQSRAAVDYAKPTMDAVLISVRPMPQVAMPVAQNQPTAQAAPPEPFDVVSWDKWHARFAELVKMKILASLAAQKNPCGSDTLKITVSRNHNVTVALETPSEKRKFDIAMQQAYRSLDGESALEFPAGSHRDTITFSIDNRYEGKGVPARVESQTSIGDKEIVRR